MQAGGWEGRGAAAFFGEMERTVLPSMQRLAAALHRSQTVTRQISHLLHGAEEETSRPFRGEGGSAPASAAAGSQPGTTQASGPPFGDYNNLANIPPLVLGPGATYRDLAAMIEQMYRINDHRNGEKYGVDEPVKIVHIGENQYLVAIIGTDAGDDGHTGPNDWLANLSSGRGVPSRFQQAGKNGKSKHRASLEATRVDPRQRALVGSGRVVGNFVGGHGVRQCRNRRGFWPQHADGDQRSRWPNLFLARQASVIADLLGTQPAVIGPASCLGRVLRCARAGSRSL